VAGRETGRRQGGPPCPSHVTQNARLHAHSHDVSPGRGSEDPGTVLSATRQEGEAGHVMEILKVPVQGMPAVIRSSHLLSALLPSFRQQRLPAFAICHRPRPPRAMPLRRQVCWRRVASPAVAIQAPWHGVDRNAGERVQPRPRNQSAERKSRRACFTRGDQNAKKRWRLPAPARLLPPARRMEDRIARQRCRTDRQPYHGASRDRLPPPANGSQTVSRGTSMQKAAPEAEQPARYACQPQARQTPECLCRRWCGMASAERGEIAKPTGSR